MSEAAVQTLVVPLSGGSARAREAVERLLPTTDPIVRPLAQLAAGRLRGLRDARYERLVLVGAPPIDEIGYGLTPVIALAALPRQVALIDLESQHVVSRTLLKHLLKTTPSALGQIVASAIAVAAQRAAIPYARHAPRDSARAQELSKLVYIRPMAGSSSGVGGSATHSHEVIRAMMVLGVSVDAFTSDTKLARAVDLDASAGYRWSLVRTPRAAKALPASAAAGGDARLVQAALPATRASDAIYQRHGRFSLVGAVLARLSQRPLLLEYNGSEQFSGKYWNPTPLQGQLAACERAALFAATRIFVVSEADRRSLVERGIDPDRIVINPNGVDAERFATNGGEEIRRRHHIDQSRLLIGFVGTFGPWHGAPVLAQAFVELARAHSHSHLLLVGDGRELDTTRQIIHDAGLDDRLTSTGAIAHSKVPQYVNACDVLVSPHVPLPDGIEFFGSPTKLFEYMAAGKAIVASALGQIADVLQDGVTARLVRPGDAAALADALSELAEAPRLRRVLGANAREQALRHHTWHINARRVIETYASIANK